MKFKFDLKDIHIPVIAILIFTFALYPLSFMRNTHSILGKLVAVFVILYYCNLGIKEGIIATVIILSFYHLTDMHYEGFESIVSNEEKPTLEAYKTEEKKEEKKEKREWWQPCPKCGHYFCNCEMTDAEKKGKFSHESNFIPNQDTKKELTFLSAFDFLDDSRAEFVKRNCKNGKLLYKDLPVKDEMASHVYSEIEFTGKRSCNVCDSACDARINSK